MGTPHITIDGDDAKVAPETSSDEPRSPQDIEITRAASHAGGIYSRRTRPGVGDRRSLSRSRTRDSEADVEAGTDWRKDQGGRKQVFSGKTLLWCVHSSNLFPEVGILTAVQARVPVDWRHLWRHWHEVGT